jgi:hypothetical protein
MDLLFDEWRRSENGSVEWRKYRKDAYRIKLLYAEMVCNIVTDNTLSQKNSNPQHYPKVPKYTPPLGRYYTKSDIKIHKREMLQKDSFIEHNIEVSTTPFPEKEIGKRLDAILNINPWILYSTSIDYWDAYRLYGLARKEEYILLANVTIVWYLVGTFIDIEAWNVELWNIYVFHHQKSLRNLMEHLQRMKVKNSADLEKTKEYISTFLP